jgi:hypothetical protein
MNAIFTGWASFGTSPPDSDSTPVVFVEAGLVNPPGGQFVVTATQSARREVGLATEPRRETDDIRR